MVPSNLTVDGNPFPKSRYSNNAFTNAELLKTLSQQKQTLSVESTVPVSREIQFPAYSVPIREVNKG